MGFEDRPVVDLREMTDSLPARAFRLVATGLRPWQGWIAFCACVALAALPAFALRANNWVRLPETVNLLAWTGALAVVCVWWAAGWHRPVRVAQARTYSTLYAAIVVLLLGAFVVSVLLINWLPDARSVVALLRSGNISPVEAGMNEAVIRFGARFSVWWSGAQAGSVIPDERVFALFATAIIWVIAALSAALTRATLRALPAMAPLLVLVAAIAFFGGSGRLYFLSALALVLLLHVALDNNRLADRWQEAHTDYNPDVLNERWLNAAALASVALLLAAVAPVFSVRAISDFYARLVAPIDARIETVRQQAFPNIETAPRYSISGTTTGLPNSFLLGSGPELNNARILELRTGDSPASYDAPPFAPYLNATAFNVYTGLGWEPDAERTVEELPADTRRTGVNESGRRLLAQTVRTFLPARTLFSAGEFAESGTSVWLQYDAQGQLATATTGAGSYTLISYTPALDEEMLRALPPWGASNPLPPGFDAFLELPPTVTERTRALSASLTAGIASPYAKALAIQDYLRTFPYNLDIPAPPPEVTDVADFFLFDLKTGYCDYYTTAFVVLARAAGLPTRFMTGYAPGDWLHDARSWLVSAADSHAWPEVYLDGVGWIPFEPTASRTPIERVGSGATLAFDRDDALKPPQPTPPGIEWNPQMLFWLLPILGLVWLAASVVRRIRMMREDPWLSLLAWGARAGAPSQPGDTPLEYGATLAALTEDLSMKTNVDGRRAAATVRAMGAAVGASRYAPAAERSAAVDEVRALWQALRPLLAELPLRKARR